MSSSSGQSPLLTFRGHSDSVWSVAASPDGKYLYSGSYDYTVKKWDSTNGQCLGTFKGHSSSVFSVAVSPDGKCVYSGSKDKTVKKWDFSSGQCFGTFHGHSDRVRSIAVSPDGKYVYSGSGDRTVKKCDASSGQCIVTFQGHSSEVASVAVSPDGEYVYSGSFDNTVKKWDSSIGRCLATFRGHSWYVFSVAVSPNENYVYSGSGDNTVKKWNASSGQCLDTFRGHSGGVISVAVSPDGKYVYGGSCDNTVKGWDASNAQCVATFQGHSDWVRSVTVSSDGKYVYSGSGDDTVKKWESKSKQQPHTPAEQIAEQSLAISKHSEFVECEQQTDCETDNEKKPVTTPESGRGKHTTDICSLSNTGQKTSAHVGVISQEQRNVKERRICEISAPRHELDAAELIVELTREIAELKSEFERTKESDAAHNGNIEKAKYANDETKSDPSDDLDEAITKYDDQTKRISGMMETYLRRLEQKIQESPLKPLTREISYNFTGNTINWTLIDKTVLEFQTVMNRLHMKFPIIKEIYDYSRLIEAFDDESPSPPLESEVARDIYSELKCCRDQKFLLCHDLQQLENKLKLDWEYIQTESAKLATLQLSLLDETDKSQDPALMVNLPELVHAKATYVSAKEKWRCQKTTLENCANNFERSIMQIGEAIQSVLLKFDSEMFKCVESLNEPVNNFELYLDRLRKSVVEALTEVHQKLQLCDYRDQDLCQHSYELLDDIRRINETEKAIDQLSTDSCRTKQNRAGEQVDSSNYVSDETDSLHSLATGDSEVDEPTVEMSQICVTEEIQDDRSIETVDSGVDWKLL